MIPLWIIFKLTKSDKRFIVLSNVKITKKRKLREVKYIFETLKENKCTFIVGNTIVECDGLIDSVNRKWSYGNQL